LSKEQLKSFFSLNKAIRSMVEGTPLKELKRSERKRSSCCTCCRNWRSFIFTVPLFETRADGQTVTQDGGAFGGNTVATELRGPIDYLRPMPVVEN
jgi:hypothetical protein